MVIYFNNILIYSQTEKEHVQYISKVLKILQNSDLSVKLEKSVFYIQKVEYLEYIISGEGVKIDPKKIYAIMKWPVLKNIFEILFFLRFANFYRRSIKEYLKVAINLINLSKKDTKWI